MASKPWERENIILQSALRDLRIKVDLTQSELAICLNRPQSYVSKYEAGERRLDIVEIMKICNACGQLLSEFSESFEKKCKS
jgi:transcriptional regulator with XRE-family HTH domain